MKYGRYTPSVHVLDRTGKAETQKHWQPLAVSKGADQEHRNTLLPIYLTIFLV